MLDIGFVRRHYAGLLNPDRNMLFYKSWNSQYRTWAWLAKDLDLPEQPSVLLYVETPQPLPSIAAAA